MSPSASREEFSSQYLDVLDESDCDSGIFEFAAEYADDELRGWGGRMQWDPVVLKVLLPSSDDEPIMTWDRHSPGPQPGVSTHRTVTCACRTHYLLPVLALAYAGIRVATGQARPGTWVRPLARRLPDLRRRPREPGEGIYSFTPLTPSGGSSLIFTSDADRAAQVLQAVRLHGRRLPCPSETRCPQDGRRLGAVFRLPDGLWTWSAGHQEPPEAARRKAAALCLDALDECNSDSERQACYAAAT